MEDIGEQNVEVWPENKRSVEVFCRMATQWHHGFGGPTGLIYSELETILRLTGEELTKEQRKELFDDIQILERSALDTLSERREADSKKHR